MVTVHPAVPTSAIVRCSDDNRVWEFGVWMLQGLVSCFIKWGEQFAMLLYYAILLSLLLSLLLYQKMGISVVVFGRRATCPAVSMAC